MRHNSSNNSLLHKQRAEHLDKILLWLLKDNLRLVGLRQEIRTKLLQCKVELLSQVK
jgi:hypothetical protein